MSAADPAALKAVTSFLNRSKLEYSEAEEQHGTRLNVRSGAQHCAVTVYNTGKVVIGGPDSPLKKLLQQMKEAVESGGVTPGQILPFEIDKFPETLRERIPDCDPVIIRFVEEVIRCVRSDALLGAAFMVGATSERAINLLIHTYGDSIKDESNRNGFLSRISNQVISKKYDEFIKSYKCCKTRPSDPSLSHDLEVLIGGMFQFCRITRNEIGHPQIVPDLDRGVLLANLGHLITYMDRIYSLMRFFKEKGVEV